MSVLREAAFFVRDGVTYYLKDEKARELLKECYSPSNPPPYALAPYAGGPATVANGLHYGQVDGTSTATVFTASITGIESYYDGLTVVLKNGVVTSAAGFTININGLGAKPVYSSLAAATQDSTIFNINYTMMFIYDSTRVTGGCWVCYRGYDSNTNTIGYQIRTNSQTMPMDSTVYRYRLLFTSADGTKFVPANNATSTNATASRAVCQTPIDPFGAIFYYGSTTALSAGDKPGAGHLWQQYTITLGYSFNRTGAALTLTSWAPVYLKCAPQTDGSAIMDSSTPFVQSLPSTDDGKIYIFLGTAYSATQIELQLHHPVYYYKDGAIRPWVNQISGGGGGATNTWYAVCSTAYSTAAKEATSATGDFVLATGSMVRVKFTNTNNQTQPTLSVDGSTPKRIKNLPSESNINTQWWRAGEVIDMVYDGTDFIMSDGGMASASYYGKTILSNSTSSASQTTAATSKAVKDTYDAIPTNVSQLTNDSGFVDAAGAAAAAPVQSVNGQTGAVNVSTIAVQDSTPTGNELVWIDTDDPGTPTTLLELSDIASSSDYLKLPDGTLICWGRVTFGSVAAGGSTTETDDFAQAFISEPHAVCSLLRQGAHGNLFPVNVYSLSTTQITLAQANAYNATVSGVTADWVAIGRWKA